MDPGLGASFVTSLTERGILKTPVDEIFNTVDVFRVKFESEFGEYLECPEFFVDPCGIIRVLIEGSLCIDNRLVENE